MSAAAPRVFCACAPGVEPVLAAELSALGLEASALAGGALATGPDAAALACLGSRVADAVLLRLWEGPAAELPRGKREAATRAGGAPLLVRTSEGPGGRPDGQATISVDAAGAPLFKRGWRERVGAAPLRESLAAALLLWRGYAGDRPLLDPMCGSGTLAIEAALLAGGRAPGLGRRFAFEDLPGHDAARTEKVRAALGALARPIRVAIHASDRNAGVLRLAQKNAAAAGVADAITFTRADAAAAVPPAGAGLLAVNPPWGIRLPLEGETAEAWRALGALLGRLRGWDVAILGPDRGFEKLLPVAPDAAVPVRNGGVACQFLGLRT